MRDALPFLAAVTLATVIVGGFAGIWRDPIPTSTRVWPADFRAVVCEAYLLSEGRMPLTLHAERVTAALSALPDYPEGRELVARLRELLAPMRDALAAQRAGNVAAMNAAMGVTERLRFRFYDALSELRLRTGEHCL